MDPVQLVLDRGAARVTRINETTRNAVQSAIADGVANGLTVNEIADAIEAGVPAFDPYRAELIARTEVMDVYNAAALATYGEAGIEMVEAIDGDQDDECIDRVARNPYTLDEADAEEDHPNGTLDWVPVMPTEAVDMGGAMSEDVTPTEDEAAAMELERLNSEYPVGQDIVLESGPNPIGYVHGRGAITGDISSTVQRGREYVQQQLTYAERNVALKLPGQAGARYLVGADNASVAIAHEYGHAIEHYLNEHGHQSDVARVVRAIRRDPPSGRALDRGEAFSEAFAAVQAGEPDRWGLLTLLGDLLP